MRPTAMIFFFMVTWSSGAMAQISCDRDAYCPTDQICEGGVCVPDGRPFPTTAAGAAAENDESDVAVLRNKGEERREKLRSFGFPKELTDSDFALRVEPWEFQCKKSNGDLVTVRYMEPDQWDVMSQWSGLKANDPDFSLTFDQYLSNNVSESCTGTGWTFYLLTEYKFSGAENLRHADSEAKSFRHWMLRVPDGMQVCRIQYDRPIIRHDAYAKFTPDFWIDDQRDEARFQGYHVELKAHGNGDDTAAVYVNNVVVFALPQTATVADRRRHNCEFPRKPEPPSIAPSPSAPTAVPRANISIELMELSGNSGKLKVQNNGDGPGKAYWEIWVTTDNWTRLYSFAGNDSGPAPIIIPPKTTSYYNLHRWGSPKWELRNKQIWNY